jgi:N-acyl-D-aspartate/D-glutamate deacylase
LNIRDEIERSPLLADDAYRRRFRKEIAKRFGPRVRHRDVADTEIVSCPDSSIVGESFADVGEQRGIAPRRWPTTALCKQIRSQ